MPKFLDKEFPKKRRLSTNNDRSRSSPCARYVFGKIFPRQPLECVLSLRFPFVTSPSLPLEERTARSWKTSRIFTHTSTLRCPNRETTSSAESHLCEHSLSHVRVCDTRLTIIVSLTKRARHRPHSGSLGIVEHKRGWLSRSFEFRRPLFVIYILTISYASSRTYICVCVYS